MSYQEIMNEADYMEWLKPEESRKGRKISPVIVKRRSRSDDGSRKIQTL